MAEGIRCSRCEQVLEPEAFAPSQRKPGSWCRNCRKGYMQRYMQTYEPKKPKCWKCKDTLPQIGGCFNGCGQRDPAKIPPTLRPATCLICAQPFILPIEARGNRKTCRNERCQAIRIGQRRAAVRGKLMPRKKPKGAHHSGTYMLRARALRAVAYSDPETKCWRCGLTLQEHKPHKNGKPARWTAGHVNDGEVGGALLPEASTCNYSAGAAAGNRKRERVVQTSRRW